MSVWSLGNSEKKFFSDTPYCIGWWPLPSSSHFSPMSKTHNVPNTSQCHHQLYNVFLSLVLNYLSLHILTCTYYNHKCTLLNSCTWVAKKKIYKIKLKKMTLKVQDKTYLQITKRVFQTFSLWNPENFDRWTLFVGPVVLEICIEK